MAEVTDGSYLSIGEVLGLLLEEFPDVTISKIRFLESQGLISPERTPSGYRKFYDADVDLLRVILTEQRLNYLPLRVIKDRLETGEIDPTGERLRPGPGDDWTDPGRTAGHASTASGGTTDDTAGVQWSTRHDARPNGDTWTADADPTPVEVPEASIANHPAARRSIAPESAPSTIALEVAAAASADPADVAARSTSPEPAHAEPAPSVTDATADDRTEPAPATSSSPTEPSSTTPSDQIDVDGHVDEHDVIADDDETEHHEPVGALAAAQLLPGVVVERGDLLSMVGMTDAELEQLESFGLVTPTGGVRPFVYDGHAVAIARAAVDFLRSGIDARHLRNWRTSAEREASLYEQLVAPRFRQRNPQARAEALRELKRLDDLGGKLRSALTRQALGHHFDI